MSDAAHYWAIDETKRFDIITKSGILDKDGAEAQRIASDILNEFDNLIK